MNITELKKGDRRIEIAFEGFQEGNSIVYENVLLQKNREGGLDINSYPDFTNPSHVNADMAKEGIARSKKVVEVLCKNNPEYQQMISVAEKQYYYCIDYHTGAYAIAKEIGGEFQWLG